MKINLKNFYILLICLMLIGITPSQSKYEKIFYDYKITSINGDETNLNIYKNKAILLVNVASYCGFTNQYESLQEIWNNYKDKGLIVLGVPSNSFRQEKKSNEEIKEFCEVNFKISFPMTSIFDVKGQNAHDIYKWAYKNHGKSAVPKWNFHKILINKKGKVEDTFNSFTKPNSKIIINKLENILK